MTPSRDDSTTPLLSVGLDGIPLDRRRIRRLLRARRRNLGQRRRRANALAVTRHLAPSSLLLGARSVGAYLPRDAELDPLPLLTILSSRGVQPMLPIIEPMRGRPPRLRFAPLVAPAQMRPNRFGIPEPDVRGARNAWTLDVVLLPLVGFDHRGGRLGMGGGFYDATFDMRRERPGRPRLIGLAHSIQEVDSLDLRDHDVPLDAVVTERGVLLPRPRD